MKSGFIAIVGRPSAGKSTLLNAMCGEKAAITSPYPQTTRNAIRGIVNTPAGQAVFLDTPGYHRSEKKLNLYLKDVVHRALDDADAVLYVVDAGRPPGAEELAIIELLKKTRLPIVAAVNKIDGETPLLAEIRGLILAKLGEITLIDVSALKGTHVDELIAAAVDVCPEGEAHYPREFYTDQPPEFRIAEIIREEATAGCEKELPYALYVDILDMEFREPEGTGPGKLWVRAAVVVERKSQVGILVGRGGEKIRSIRTAALRQMRGIFPWDLRLDLRVKVNAKWRGRDALLRRMLQIGD